jgi:hypothetical protein
MSELSTQDIDEVKLKNLIITALDPTMPDIIKHKNIVVLNQENIVIVIIDKEV